MRAKLSELLKTACRKLNLESSDTDVYLEIPQQEGHGDFSTNAALSYAPQLKVSARQLAEQLSVLIRAQDTDKIIKHIEIAGPGFINFFVSDSFLQNSLCDIFQSRQKYGASRFGQGKSVLLEFVSANPTGPLHLGHGRWAVLGDAISNLLKICGFRVVKEYYINDSGRQIELLVASVKAKKNRQAVPAGGYQGRYLGKIPFSREDKIIKYILAEQKSTLNKLGVKFNRWFSEKKLKQKGKVAKIVEMLKRLKFTYKQDGALWFKSSSFGDDKDRVLIRENGEYTYFAADIAYHQDKFKRKYNYIIDIWGADHHGYLERIKAAMQALGNLDGQKQKLEVIIGQLVSLYRGKEQVKMSKRSGEIITLSEVIAEVGKDAARFFFLLNSAQTHLDFDLELAVRHSADNPVYYVQYAHARICSIFAEAEKKLNRPRIKLANLSLLKDKSERDLIRKLSDFPACVEKAALTRSPHRLTAYALEVAKIFHSFYHKCRVVSADFELSLARLYLLFCTRTVLANVLKLLDITAPERM